MNETNATQSTDDDTESPLDVCLDILDAELSQCERSCGASVTTTHDGDAEVLKFLFIHDFLLCGVAPSRAK
jgi:hypothetical protein